MDVYTIDLIRVSPFQFEARDPEEKIIATLTRVGTRKMCRIVYNVSNTH